MTLRDIADALGVKQAALYYHVPGGKEELFVEVLERTFEHHRLGLERALAKAKPKLSEQLTAIALWLIAQPPLDLSRLARSDIPSLSGPNAQKIYALGTEALTNPILRVLEAAKARGEIRKVNLPVMTGIFLAMIDTLHDIEKSKGVAKEAIAREAIDVWVNGLRKS